MQYKSYIIPPGTPFSMSTYSMHQNDMVFPSPETFDPSRWLPDPATGEMPVGPVGEKLLTRYLTPFLKGARQCLGMTLAYAELYILIANLFRRCDMELFETSDFDATMYSDQRVPFPHPDSKGVRVLVK
jgi:cytochrome P450